ncbi:Ger(x)C family spore germination protein [Desulfosporosinus fructosivorans]
MKKIISTTFCIILLLMLPGCWNRRELNTLAIVQAVGIDRTEDGQINVSLQILKPSAIKASTSEKASGTKSVWVVTSKGETVFDAIRNAALQTDRKSYFSHNTVYVLSERIAKEGIRDELDLLSRDPEFRKSAFVFISQTKAEDIIRSEHEQEKIPGQAIEKLAQLSFATSKIPKDQFIDLHKNLTSKTNDSIIPGISLLQGAPEASAKNVFKLDGSAILKSDKLIGWFDAKETRGVLWIRGEVKSGIVVVPTPGDETKKSGIEIIKASSRIVPERVDGNLVLTINVEVMGNLGEQMNTVDLGKPEPFKELEEKTAMVIEEEIYSAIDKAQRWEVDLFEFGTEVHRQFPKEWPALEKNWREEFQKIQVNVVVDAELRWTGFIKQPILPPTDEGEDT